MSDVTLAGWLLEQIAADDEVARAAADVGPPPWYWGYGGPQGKYGLLTGLKPHWRTAGAVIYGDPDRDTADHIARHDPARVLAECEAKRRIVGEQPGYPFWDMDGNARAEWERVLRLLALPYADRPGYDESWRP